MSERRRLWRCVACWDTHEALEVHEGVYMVPCPQVREGYMVNATSFAEAGAPLGYWLDEEPMVRLGER
jgi:hypothetical protein